MTNIAVTGTVKGRRHCATCVRWNNRSILVDFAILITAFAINKRGGGCIGAVILREAG
jgi:hypothetical protein